MCYILPVMSFWEQVVNFVSLVDVHKHPITIGVSSTDEEAVYGSYPFVQPAYKVDHQHFVCQHHLTTNDM